MPRQIQGSQHDFSFGEIDLSVKRADDNPARKNGLRQMANARILNSGAVQNRSGRRALYPGTNSPKRTERFTISPGNIYDIQFAAGRVKIIDNTGTTVGNFTLQGNGAALPWTAGNLNTIVYAIFNKSITITFGHSMRPQVITWDGVVTWSIADYAETIAASGQKLTPFYRISPQGITLQPSAITGSVTVLASNSLFTASWIGVRFRYAGRQLLVTAFTDSTHVTALVIEPLPPSQTLTLGATVGAFTFSDVVLGATSGARGIVASNPKSQTIFFSINVSAIFLVGDAVSGGTSGATGIVSGLTGLKTIVVSLSTGTLFNAVEVVTSPRGNATSSGVTGGALILQIIPGPSGIAAIFTSTEVIAGPSGSATVTGISTGVPQPITDWDDEIMNDFRGYPGSCFADNFRLGFCDFNSVPGGIAWSAINSPTDLNIGANPRNAMFELVPDKTRVLYVVAGAESSEFVFCDSKLYYIKIDPSNPLKPGSISFQTLSSDGCAQVQPRASQEAILYVNAGQSSMMAIIAPGSYYRPFNTKSLTEFHNHLFSNIKAIAVPTADGTFEERYAYVLNGDGSIAVGKYTIKEGQIGIAVGWGPWSGAASVNWIAASGADVLFTSNYFGSDVVEIIDDAQYLDCALPVNALPASFVVGGKGPLWLIAPGQSVTLIDQGTRFMGTYQIDANGFIIPQFNGGEDLTLASLVAGQMWNMTVEPFAPMAQSGADLHQRMMRRRISNFAAYVVNSTGFTLQKLFSRKQTLTSPALGTPMSIKRVGMWNVGEDPTLPPKQRETMESWRPSGHSFEPRVCLIKDSPGPLQIIELGMEISL